MDLRLQALSPRSLLVSWQPPPPDQQNGVITYYIIIVEDEDGAPFRADITKQLQITLEGVAPFQSYSVHMAAATQIGTGPHTIPSLLIEMPEAGVAIARYVEHISGMWSIRKAMTLLRPLYSTMSQ